MYKEDVVFLYNEILLSHTKEGNNMDVPWEYYAKWKRQDKNHMLLLTCNYKTKKKQMKHQN